MLDPIPSCFRGGAGGSPPPSTAAGPTLSTSFYETSIGLAALSWSRTALGLLLRADLRLSLDDDGDSGGQDRPLSFKIRPWLFFHRRGSKRFHVKTHSIDFAWDLTRAKFPSSGGPEPAGSFFVSVAVDGEIILVAGDLDDLAFKRAKLKKRDLKTSLISRKEQVTMREDRSYKTQARFGGKERSISIDLGGEMSLEVDGKPILQIRRLRWKFRGSERVQLEGGDRIQLSWDLHNWLFTPKDGGGGDRSSSSTGNAVFVFRFESEETEQGHFGKKGEEYCGKEGVYKGTLGGYFGKNRNWSESSSGGGGGENGKKKGKNGSSSKKKKSLLKTSSSSSSSSASSSASSTVMEWASPEENELRSKEGFSLLVYAWKS